MSDNDEEAQADDDFGNESINFDMEEGADDRFSVNAGVYSLDSHRDPRSTNQVPPYSTGRSSPYSSDNDLLYSTDQAPPFSTDQGPSQPKSLDLVRAPVPSRPPNLTRISEENSMYLRSTEDERPPAGANAAPEEPNSSVWSNGFAASFSGAPQAGNNSEEFVKGTDARKLIDQAEESFQKSGRRLDIPEGFDSEKCTVPRNSWENGSTNKNKNNPFDLPYKPSDPVPREAPVSTAKRTTGVHEAEMRKPAPRPVSLTQPDPLGTPQKPATPTDPPDLHMTPVRPKSKNSFRREPTFVASTPKAESTMKQPPDFGNVSVIPLNTTMDSTMGNALSETQLHKAMGSVGPKASIGELMTVLENFRTGQKSKAEERIRSRVEFRATASGRMPLKEKQLERPPIFPKHDTSATKQREVDISRPPLSRMSSTASSLSTAVGRSLHISSRSGNTETVSDTYSRASSVASMRDCGSRPDTRLSIASVYSTDDGNAVTVDRTILPFSYVDVGQTFVDVMRISNRGQVPLSLTLSLRKDGAGYTILDGTTRQLEAGREMDIRLEFRPLVAQRHNNHLKIRTSTSQEFTIFLRGTGGTSSVSIEPTREKITKNKYGMYLMKPIRDDGVLQFKLKSSGERRAFCKAMVFGDGQVIPAGIAPLEAVVLKKGTEQMFQIKVPDIGRYLTCTSSRGSTVSLASSADGGENIRLKIIVFWGDDGQRQRAQHFLRKSNTSVQDPIVQTLMETRFVNEKPFVEPAEWHVSRADVKHFEMGLNKAEIAVLPLAVSRLSNMDDFDDTLVSESTFTDRDMVKERTFVPDTNDTIMPSR